MALSCYVTSNIAKQCRNNVGGISKVYVLAACLTGITEDAEQFIETVGAVSGFCYQYEFEKQTSSWTENITGSLENGTIFFESQLTLVFFKLQQDIRNQVKLLGQNTNLKIFVETNDGSIFFLGERFGLTLTSGSAATGTAFGDRNGYELVFTGLEPEPAKQLLNSVEQTLVGITLVTNDICL